MKVFLRICLSLIIVACCTSAVQADNCNVVVLGFDEEKTIDHRWKGVQWLKLGGRQVRDFNSRDILLFDNVRPGSEFSYVEGVDWMQKLSSFFVECNDTSPTYLMVEDDAFRQLSAEKFAEVATNYESLKLVKPNGRGFTHKDKPFSDLSQLANLLGIESAQLAKSVYPGPEQDPAQDTQEKKISAALKYQGNTEQCNVAILGFEREGRSLSNRIANNWLKLDGKPVKGFDEHDIVLFEKLPTGSQLGNFFGAFLTDRYFVDCREDRPALLRINHDLGYTDAPFEELEFNEFVKLAQDYTTVKHVTVTARGFNITESAYHDPKLLAKLIGGMPGPPAATISVVESKPDNSSSPQKKSTAEGSNNPFRDFNGTSKNRNAVAVIIGNKNYTAAGKTVPNVSYAHNDAEVIRDYVVKVLGFREGNIMFLKDAAQSQLVSIFGNDKSHKAKLFNWIRPELSDVFVYYSGHGAPSLNDGKGYLLPVDADPTTVEFNGYALETLYKNLKKIPARSVTIVLDACFSGSSSEGAIIQNASSISLKRVDTSNVASNVTLFTAAGVSEVASWDTEEKHGLFTSHFVKGVSGEADGGDFGNQDGKVSLAELRKYLKSEVTYTARRRYNREQHPEIIGGDSLIMATLK